MAVGKSRFGQMGVWLRGAKPFTLELGRLIAVVATFTAHRRFVGSPPFVYRAASGI
jgi:hypothetical protein